ncbi:MAG: T9SS type A sorting domain-containing protein [Chitinophagales bacterium]
MKTIFQFQYARLLCFTFFLVLVHALHLQAQCSVWIDFTDESVVPDGCGTVWTEDNEPIDLQIIAVDDTQYTCSSSEADCTHTKDENGLALENSVLELEIGSLVNMYKLHVGFSAPIEEGNASLSLFNGNILLETVLPNSFGYFIFQDAAVLQQATKVELFVCEGIVEVFALSYDCLGINQGGANYCNMFDSMDILSLGGNFDENEALLSIGDGVLVYQEPVYDLFYSSSWWLGISVLDNDIFGNPFSTGKNVKMHGSLRFDFSSLPDPVQKVQFAVEKPFLNPTDYWQPINIRVNGEDLVIAQNIWDLTSIAPNVSLSVTGTSPQIVTLTGEIEELVIGAHNTHLSLFCYETGIPVQEEQDNCLFFEGVVEGSYETKNDFKEGDFLFAEDGVAVYLQNGNFYNPPFVIGGVEVYSGGPEFGSLEFGNPDFGIKQFMSIDTAAVEFDFGGHTEQVVSVNLSYIGNAGILQINNETWHEGYFSDMPTEIADGVSLTVTYDATTLMGELSLEGNIRRMTIGSTSMWIDDVCFETAPYILPDNACFDFDDLFFTRFGSRSFVTDAYTGEMIYNYEGLPISLEGNQVGGEESVGAVHFNVSDDGSGHVFVEDGGVGFDFGAIGKTVTSVSFEYENNGTFNLTINNLPTIEVVNSEIVGDIPDGFLIVIDTATVSITGAVEKLIIGGEPILIDNLCYTAMEIEDAVWPGDTNSDGVANNFDLLPIGIAYINEGSPRINPTLDWVGQAADDWIGNNLASGVNYKHIDCNGDGEILLDDLEGIIQNYGKTHAKSGGKSGSPDDAPLYVELPEETLNNGDKLTAPIILGTMDIPVTDVHGIAFTVNFDSELVDAQSVAVSFEDCWLGTEGENLVTLSKSFGEEGVIDVAITRLDQVNQTGYGTIGTLTGIIDNIAGKKKIQQDLVVTVSNVRAISADETDVPVFPTADTVIVTDIQSEIVTASIEVFPNPATSHVFLRVPEYEKLQTIEVFNSVGKLQNVLYPNSTNNSEVLQLELSDLQSGMYFLRMDYDGVLVSKKLWVLE